MDCGLELAGQSKQLPDLLSLHAVIGLLFDSLEQSLRTMPGDNWGTLASSGGLGEDESLGRLAHADGQKRRYFGAPSRILGLGVL